MRVRSGRSPARTRSGPQRERRRGFARTEGRAPHRGGRSPRVGRRDRRAHRGGSGRDRVEVGGREVAVDDDRVQFATEVQRDRRFTDAAFAAADGDDHRCRSRTSGVGFTRSVTRAPRPRSPTDRSRPAERQLLRAVAQRALRDSRSRYRGAGSVPRSRPSLRRSTRVWMRSATWMPEGPSSRLSIRTRCGVVAVVATVAETSVTPSIRSITQSSSITVVLAARYRIKDRRIRSRGRTRQPGCRPTTRARRSRRRSSSPRYRRRRPRGRPSAERAGRRGCRRRCDRSVRPARGRRRARRRVDAAGERAGDERNVGVVVRFVGVCVRVVAG